MFAKSILMSSLLLAAGAIAQTPSPAPTESSATNTDGNMVQVQMVAVAKGDPPPLRFEQEEIKADVNTMVQFQFYTGSHTATQSTFDNPCVPINKINSSIVGINSGPMPPQNGMMKIFTIMINDTKPIWIYCATGTHCQQGMAMVINPPTSGDKTLANYKEAAKRFDPAKANNTSSNGATVTGPTETGSSDAPSTGSASSQFNTMIGGTAVASFVVAAFVLFL